MAYSGFEGSAYPSYQTVKEEDHFNTGYRQFASNLNSNCRQRYNPASAYPNSFAPLRSHPPPGYWQIGGYYNTTVGQLGQFVPQHQQPQSPGLKEVLTSFFPTSSVSNGNEFKKQGHGQRSFWIKYLFWALIALLVVITLGVFIGTVSPRSYDRGLKGNKVLQDVETISTLEETPFAEIDEEMITESPFDDENPHEKILMTEHTIQQNFTPHPPPKQIRNPNENTSKVIFVIDDDFETSVEILLE